MALEVGVGLRIASYRFMNRALWRKGVSDSAVWLLASSGLLLAFAWVFVWLTSLFQLGAWATMLGALPEGIQSMFAVPIARLASPAGQVSMVFVHPVVILVCVTWAVGRGSDCVSGEIARGTMDLLLTLPIRRASVLVVSAVLSTAGAAVLATSLWLGVALGILSVRLQGPVTLGPFLVAAGNLFCLTFCLTGLTAFFSSWDHNRWRSMALGVGLFVSAFLIRLISRAWKAADWLKYLSILTPFEPQQLMFLSDGARLAWRYNATLLGIGLSAYLAAAVIFTFRDIPQR
jgi:ABC-2 type transport system permease protein